MWKYDANLERYIPVEEWFVEKHEIGCFVVLDLPLLAEHQLRELHLFGCDAVRCLAQLYPQFLGDCFGIELALSAGEGLEHGLYVIELRGRVGDGDFADLSSFPFVEIVGESAHEAQFRH